MIKTIRAKYPGRCSKTGAAFQAGAAINYDTKTRRAFLAPPGLVITYNEGRPQYFMRNPRGRCIDAPCCGCCTI